MKKTAKKLTLNTQTVRSLSLDELAKMAGAHPNSHVWAECGSEIAPSHCLRCSAGCSDTCTTDTFLSLCTTQ